jgi:cytochrome c-type biogenesis protein CcmH/NrfG
MSQGLIQVNVRNPVLRLALLLVLIVAGVWSYFVVKWYLGNTFAEYFDPAASNFDIAHLAVSMAPKDPLTHWRLAEVLQGDLSPEKQAEAIAEYEKAVNLSPNDYRFWTSLGIAYERMGDKEKARQALQRAVDLAPSYAYPHWFLGNLYLRNARYDEAFAELRFAGRANPEFQSQLFSLAWQVYSPDPEAMKRAVGDNAADRAAFALYLLSQQHYDEGLRIWNDLGTEDKKKNLNTASEIIATLRKAFRFHDALKVWNDSSPDEYHTKIDQVFDGGFEKPVSYGPEIVFGWQVNATSQMQIGIDPARSHSGSRSLKLVFQVRQNLEAVNVFQLVPVEPNAEYDLEWYLTTDNLVSGSTPQVDVLDLTDNKVIASSAKAPGGTNRWDRFTLSFKTSDRTEGVFLRVVRTSCATDETPVCPIFGSIWYDDFSIKRRN